MSAPDSSESPTSLLSRTGSRGGKGPLGVGRADRGASRGSESDVALPQEWCSSLVKCLVYIALKSATCS